MKSEARDAVSSMLDDHSKSIGGQIESVWQEPTEDMLYYVNSEQGVVKLHGIRFHLNRRFNAGTYIITCKDVTPGLPPRMLMKTVKVLLKIVDLTEHSETLLEASKAVADTKKKPAGRK
jgi:hypothetical protein